MSLNHQYKKMAENVIFLCLGHANVSKAKVTKTDDVLNSRRDSEMCEAHKNVLHEKRTIGAKDPGRDLPSS